MPKSSYLKGERTGVQLEKLSKARPNELTKVDYGRPSALGLKVPTSQALPKLGPGSKKQSRGIFK